MGIRAGLEVLRGCGTSGGIDTLYPNRVEFADVIYGPQSPPIKKLKIKGRKDETISSDASKSRVNCKA